MIWHAGDGRPDVDHAAWDAVASRFVSPAGRFDYTGLAADDRRPRPARRVHRRGRRGLDTAALTRDAHLATAINAYNAWTIRLILDHFEDGQPPASIKDIPEAERWSAVRWTLGGQEMSLDMLEHLLIRPWFDEPRIHFALVCAAVSCPPLRAEAYTAERLEEQLEEQMILTHRPGPWVQMSESGDEVRLSSLYKWYGVDFVPTLDQPVPDAQAKQLLPAIAPYVSAVEEKLDHGSGPAVAWIPYSWAINTPEAATATTP